ncbi:hypothetical protein GCM10028801_21850 [Nocardioides maradonensis]
MIDAEGLESFLRSHPPFSSASDEVVSAAARAARVRRYARGALVLDAFTKANYAVWVVVEGRMDVWNDAERFTDAPDEVLGPGGLFGFSSMLTGGAIGPRAVAGTDTVVARIPRELVAPVFTSAAGAEFLAAQIARKAVGRQRRPVEVPLHDRLQQAESVEELRTLTAQTPLLLSELLHEGLASSRVIAEYSAIIDTIVRRAIGLVLAGHRDLSVDAFTWLSLGSNGRREAVPSSDVDAAVAFDDAVPEARIDGYLAAFGEIDDLLASLGLSVDAHGATPARRAFARTNREWRDAAHRWLASPERDQGAIMTSLLVDARPIHGDPGLPEVSRVFGELRTHPGTMRLLLHESLAKRARRRSVRDLLNVRREVFDVKENALLPIVNLARWAALSAGSSVLSTTERLEVAGGTAILPGPQAGALDEVFQVLQRLRLRYQLRELSQGRPPTDVIRLDSLSPINRSIIVRAAHEVAVVQRRMDNVSTYAEPDSWTAPER